MIGLGNPTDIDVDADSYTLSVVGLGTTASDLLLDGAGSAGPLTPDNYLQRITLLVLTNTSTVAGVVTIQTLNPTTAVTRVLGVFNVAVGGTLPLDQTMVRLIAQSGFKFQAVASAGTFSVFATTILTKGAGR